MVSLGFRGVLQGGFSRRPGCCDGKVTKHTWNYPLRKGRQSSPVHFQWKYTGEVYRAVSASILPEKSEKCMGGGISKTPDSFDSRVL